MSKELYAAIASVQAEATSPKKGSANPHFRSKYADINAVLEVLHEPLQRHGLAVVQIPIVLDKAAGVHTRILHVSGAELDCGTLMLPLEKHGPQAVGSCVTYSRRYALSAIWRLGAEDDDGEQAEGRGPSKTQTKSPTKSPTKPDRPEGECPRFTSGPHAGKRYDEAPAEFLQDLYNKHKDALSADKRDWLEFALMNAFTKDMVDIGLTEPATPTRTKG